MQTLPKTDRIGHRYEHDMRLDLTRIFQYQKLLAQVISCQSARQLIGMQTRLNVDFTRRSLIAKMQSSDGALRTQR